MKRRDFVKQIGIAGGLAALPWQGALGADPTVSSPARPSGHDDRQDPPARSADDNDPGAAGEAWQALVEVLRTCDRSFIDGQRGRFDDAEMAYGYRNLAHIVTFATQLYLYGDPDAPVFIPVQDAPIEKTLGGNPDVLYSFAPVRGDRRYRITGRRGDEAYLAFTLHRGTRGSGFQQFFQSHLNQHALKSDANGNFEVIVSPKREGENWLQSSPDATEVYARVYLFDPDRDRPARFRIESLDTPLPRRLGRNDVAERLRQMTQIIQDLTRAMPQPLKDPNRVGDLWQVERDGPSQMWQALDNVYCRGVFALEPAQALVLEGQVGSCDYWGIQLWNPFLGSGDYRLGPVSINTSRAHLGRDGSFRVAIAREDPRVPGLDWIHTAGEHQGTFFIRWMCPKTKPTAPTCRLVTLPELRAAAPPRS